MVEDEEEEAVLLLSGEGLEGRVEGGVEGMFGMGFLGVGVEVEGVFGVEVRSGGGEGVLGCWENGLLVINMLLQSRYGYMQEQEAVPTSLFLS